MNFLENDFEELVLNPTPIPLEDVGKLETAPYCHQIQTFNNFSMQTPKFSTGKQNYIE